MTPTSIMAWTLLHFVWQGALVAGLLALLLGAARGLGAPFRYGASVVALALLASLPVATALRLSGSTEAYRVQSPPSDAGKAQPAGEPTPVDDAALVAGDGRAGMVVSAARRDASATPDADIALVLTRLTARVEHWGNHHATTLVAAWLVGVLLLSVRLLGGWIRVRRLTTDGTREASQAMRRVTVDLAARLGVRRAVRLVESTRVHVPAVVGWLRPMILMPLSLESGLPQRELELLLAHELAHIRRHDYLINLLQTVVETILFYHPAVWWISRQIREERENCCDDVAVALCSDRRAYAEALLRLERLRQPMPELVAAATGGNLVRRIRRLLLVPNHHVESRPRWAAIPIGLTALSAIVGGMRLDSQPAPPAVLPPVISDIPTQPPVIQQARSRNARPDTVIRYEGSASLDARWNWAAAGARRDRRPAFWVGYSIAHNTARGWVYLDRHVPVLTNGGSMSGYFRFRGSPQGLTFTGARLDSLIGPRSPEELIVLFGYSVAGSVATGRVELDRVHVGSGMLPVHFAGRSLYWVGEADDASSIALTRRLFAESRQREVRHDLVSVVGAHSDEQAVLAALRAWLASDESEDLRANVAEQLATVGTPAAIGLMARTARADRSRQVRREAAEGLGEHELPEAADTLVRLVRELQDTEVRREAIEALGERSEPVAFEALVRVAWDDPSTEMQREAIETIGESSDPSRTKELERILRDHTRAGARQEAAETLGEVDQPAEALRALRDAIDRDRDPDVRHEAIETLGEIGDVESLKLLEQIARTHRDADAQKKALETLADHGDKGAVLEILDDLLNRATDSRVQKSAIEALGDFDDERAVQMLEKAATRHPESSLQRASVEALGSAAPVESAWAALNRIVFTHPREEVQRAAVEALGDIEHTGVAALLAKIAGEHPRRTVQRAAVEALGNVDRDEARTTLERLARSATDEELQVAAIEALASSASADEVIRLLGAVARNGASERAQGAALEALADLDDDAGVPVLIDIARSHRSLTIRRKAIEHLGDSEDPRAHAELARLLKDRN